MPRLTLNNPVKARKRLAKVINSYEIDTETDGTPPTVRVRTLAYMHQVLQGYFKIDVDERIEELERFAEQGGFRRAKQ